MKPGVHRPHLLCLFQALILCSTMLVCTVERGFAQCTGLGSLTFNVVSGTTPTLTFDNTACVGETTVISVDQTFSSYSWSNGASTQSISVVNGGTYTVTVSSGSGCTGTAVANVTVIGGASFGLTTTSFACQLNLNGPAGFSTYTWSNGQTGLPIIQANTSGTYTLTVTDAVGCSATSSITVSVPPNPVVSLSGNSGFCPGSNSILTATPGFPVYQWSNGAPNANTTTITAAGTYTVTVFDNFGCTDTETITITATAVPVPTIAPAPSICTGQSATLQVSNGPFAGYAWTGGGNGASIQASTGGLYTVTVTDASGCTGTATTSLTVIPPPSIAITIPAYACNGSLLLQATPGFSNYNWSTSQNGPSISVNSPGTYTVIVTDGNGCSNSTASNVSIPPAPVVSISGNLSLCSGSSTQIFANSGFASYQWSGGLGNTSQASINSAGTYTVTATDAFGCTDTESVTITANTSPSPLIQPMPAICQGQSATLALSNGPFSGYAWSNGSNTATSTTVTAGNYTVTVTDANGCTGTSTASLVVNPLPSLNIAQQPYACNGQITINATSGLTNYVWASGQTTAAITVSNAGIYTVTATGTGGCTASTSFSVSIPAAPVVVINGGGQICAGASAVLSATPGFASYTWSNSQSNSAISVTQNGTYFVTVTDGFGCTATGSASVVVAPQPTVQINGPTSICAGGTATYTTNNAFSSYAWSTGSAATSITVSNPGSYSVIVTDINGCTAQSSVALSVGTSINVPINQQPYQCNGLITLEVGSGFSSYTWSNGASTPTIDITSSGTYAVTVTSASGCTGASSTNVTIPDPAFVAISGPPQFCAGASATLSAGGGFANYAWSTGTLNQSITIVSAGTYTVTVSDFDGCTASATTSIIAIAAPQPSIVGPANICANSTAALSLTGVGPGSSIVWSTGASTPGIQVGAGTYGVTVTNAAGCLGADNFQVNLNTSLSPGIAAQPYTCNGQITLDAGAGYLTYAWSTANNSQVTTATASGNYTVTVTDASGCSGTASINVNIPPPPAVSIAGAAAVCAGGSATFEATSGLQSYIWSTGSSLPQITVTAPGSYTVTATDAAGCTATASQSLTVSAPISLQIAGSTSLCNGSNTTLSTSQPFATYSWSTGQTTPTISVSNAGAIGLTVTDANGCSATATTNITVSNSLSPGIAQQPYTCNGQITLDAGAGYLTYAWSTANNSQVTSATASGNYTVTVTDASGCSGTASINVNIPPPPAVSIAGAAAVCAGASATFEATSGLQSYIWSTGSSLPQITVSAPGSYTVTATDAAGCTATASQSLTVSAPISLQIAGSTSLCNGSNTTLSTSQPFATYSWSTGQTTPTISVSNAGAIGLTVTDANGCSATATTNITVSTSLSPGIAQQPYNCNGQITLDAGAGYLTYAWSTATNSQVTTATASGNYTVTVTDASGCSGTASININIPPPPAVSIAGAAAVCAGANATFEASSGLQSYIWSTGSSLPQITVTAPGNYTVTATDAAGCTATASQSLTVSAPISLQIAGSTSLCNGSNTTLSTSQPFATYSWSTGQTTPTISVSNAGVIGLTVTDANGCSATATTNITVSTSLSPGIVQQPYNCNGQITLDAGVGYLTYAWSTANNSQVTTATASGNYTVTVTDASGCSGTASINVNIPPPPAVSIAGAAAVCAGASATFEATSGLQSYIWSTGSSLPQITVTAPGSYTVTATDAAGCTATASQSLTVSAPISLQIAGSTSLCNGSNSTLSTSQPFATYSWSTGQTTPTISVSNAGAIGLTVTDANGCTGQASATITISNSLQFQPSALPYQCNGLITGDAGSGFALYQWSNGSTNQTTAFTQSGIYSVTVSNSVGCTGTATITVTIPAQTAVAVSGSQSLCLGSSAVLNAVATNPLSYLWSTGSSLPQITVNQAGTYAVTVTDVLGCTATNQITVAAANITAPVASQIPTCDNNLLMSASTDPQYLGYAWSNGANTTTTSPATPGVYTVTVTGLNGCTASASVTVTAGVAPTVAINASTNAFCVGSSATLSVPANYVGYAWSNGDDESTITVSAAGVYTVTVTDQLACTATNQVTITAYQLPQLSIQGTPVLNCDAAGAEITVVASNGAQLQSYSWSSGDLTAEIVPQSAGTYTVVVVDSQGCSNSLEVVVEQLYTNQNFTDSIEFVAGEVLQLVPPASGFVPQTVVWTNPDILDCINCPVANATPTENTFVTYLATSAGGCTLNGTFYLNTNAREVSAPYFTPNVLMPGSTNNAGFTIYSPDALARIRFLRVYSRWGELMANLIDLTPGDVAQGWQGDFKGRPVNPGVYVWVAEVIGSDGKVELLSGEVTVAR